MRLSFRAKLLAVVATATLALVSLVVVSSVLGNRVSGHLEDIRRHYLPRVGLRPQLEGQFERIQRGFQDAVAANDVEKLAGTAELKKQFLQQLAAAQGAVDPALVSLLSDALEDFHAIGMAVSRRLIAGETGESVVAQMGELQSRQKRVAELLDKATAFDRAGLTSAFSAAAEAESTASNVRVAVSTICLAVVFLLFFWISRNLLRSVAHLTAGFRRFGAGDFGTPIPVDSSDELGDLARQANQMSSSLQRLESERSGAEWFSGGRAGLAERLRGELEPKEAADRAVSFFCDYLGCPVGALHFADADGAFRLLGRHAVRGEVEPFRAGEGVAGEAALRQDVTVMESESGRLRIRSGLVEGTAKSLALVPLLRNGRAIGVLELASLHPWEPRATELLLSSRETLAIALEVARGRAELRALLSETELQRGALEEKNLALVDTRRRLEQQTDELTRASAYKSQFLANMSHELRTPLNAIIGFAQLLHDEEVGPLEDQQKDFLNDVLRSGRHLLQLINDVLDLAKVEAGKLEFRPEPIDPAKVVVEVLAVLRTTASTGRVEVHSEIDPAVGELVLDPARLKQVLYNFVSNALKFTPPGGSVHIRLAPQADDRFLIEVEDTGKGIEPEDLARLFVEFQQIHDGSDKSRGGTGLGLSLTKRLVEAQGGKVGVRSTVGKGSTFFAVLPRRTPTIVPLPEAQSQSAAADADVPTILVIEDNPADQVALTNVLAKAGYAVQLAATGEAAIALSRTRSFDAVTLDLFLPDMTGLEVLNRIRTEGVNKEIPVVVVTVVAERGAVAGFAVQDVLPKPVEASALIGAMVRSGVAPGREGTILVIDDDPGSLKLISATLKQLGYSTRTAGGGEEALRMLRDLTPSAVILDLIMPEMNGFQFLERLRSDPARRQMPVIVWTVKDLTSEERDFLRSSTQAVVSKGQGGNGILAELKAVVGKRPAA